MGTRLNPQFDSRILALPFLQNGKDAGAQLVRGQIMFSSLNAPNTVPGIASGDYVETLYNPNEIDINVGVNSSLPVGWMRNPQDTGTYAAPLNTSVSFSFLFDRTYECWSSAQTRGDTLNQNSGGVLMDTMALMRMLGIVDLQGRQEALTPVFVDVIIGQVVGMTFHGWVNECDFTYTHFTQSLVPQKAVVNFSLYLTPIQATASSESAGESSGSTPAAPDNSGNTGGNAGTSSTGESSGSGPALARPAVLSASMTPLAIAPRRAPVSRSLVTSRRGA